MSYKDYSELIRSFMLQLEAFDIYTYNHSIRTALIAKRLASELHYPKADIETIYIAGLLHDIGKLKVGRNIIKGNGELSKDEWDVIKRHPFYGIDMVPDVRLKGIELIKRIIVEHHERMDGSGYPYGIDDPLPESMLVAVADSFDAMNSDRSYKKKLDKEEIREILSWSKAKYDPLSLDALIRLIDRKELGFLE